MVQFMFRKDGVIVLPVGGVFFVYAVPFHNVTLTPLWTVTNKVGKPKRSCKAH